MSIHKTFIFFIKNPYAPWPVAKAKKVHLDYS